MLYQRSQPIGIDREIADLQKELFEVLRGVWALSPEDWQCWPRVYRNRASDGFHAEVHTEKGNYRDVYLDDKKAVTSFFGVANTKAFTATNSAIKQSVHLVFFVNISRLYAASIHRPDERVQNDVIEYFARGGQGFQLKGLVTGVEACLAEYSATRNSSLLIKADMHPYHTFRVDLETIYHPAG